MGMKEKMFKEFFEIHFTNNYKGFEKNHSKVLEKFYVDAKDRKYQIWERNPLSIDLWTKEVFIQKMEYIHYNSVAADLCNLPEEYKYSSAKFYETAVDEFNMLTHWMGEY
jgi:putative transposase